MKTLFVALSVCVICSIALAVFSVAESIGNNKKEKTEQVKTAKVVKTKK